MIAIRGSIMLALELKSDVGKPTEDQVAWLHALAGVRHVESAIVRPADTMDELERYLSAWEDFGS